MQAPKVVMLMYKYHKKTSEERHEEIDRLAKRLEEGTSEYLQSDKYKELLKTFDKFHDYSLNNSILIFLQQPHASYVASYTSWKNDFNRQVRKGEKAIKILCPIPHKVREVREKLDPVTLQPILKPDGTPETEVREAKLVTSFRVGSTFDISQTDPIDNGKPTPDLEIVHDLQGDVKGYEDLKNAIIASAPVPVSFADIDGEARGYYSSSEDKIVVRSGMAQQQTIKTLIHETTHSILDNAEEIKKREDAGLSPLPPMDKEIRAESTAYVVASHYGLDTSEYSFPYVASWAGDEERIKDNLQVIKDTSSQLIDKIDKQLELQHTNELTDSKQIVSDKRHELDADARKLTDDTVSFFKQNDPAFGRNEAYKGAAVDEIYCCIRHGKTENLQKKINNINGTDQTKLTAKKLSEKIQKFTERVQVNLSLEHTHTHSISRSR